MAWMLIAEPNISYKESYQIYKE